MPSVNRTLGDYNLKERNQIKTKLIVVILLIIPLLAVATKSETEPENKNKDVEVINTQLETKIEPKVEPITTCEQAIEKIWPKELQVTAKAIAHAESGMRPKAKGGPNRNGSYDYGCFQYNWGYENYGEKIYDPEFNAKVAYENKYLKGGWTHWSVYNNGRYLQWLHLYSG